jgi:hypothetical protein
MRRALTTETSEPRFERFCLAYPSGTAVMAYYGGGAALGEVQASPPGGDRGGRGFTGERWNSRGGQAMNARRPVGSHPPAYARGQGLLHASKAA